MIRVCLVTLTLQGGSDKSVSGDLTLQGGSDKSVSGGPNFARGAVIRVCLVT